MAENSQSAPQLLDADFMRKLERLAVAAKRVQLVVHDFEPQYSNYTEKLGYQIEAEAAYKDLDPAREMTALYREAWHGVRAVFTPILPPAAVSILDEVDAALDAAPPDWDAIRAAASVARTELPNLGERSAPRAWLDQIVLGPHHLLVRRQIEPEEDLR